jgi:hypothetical protein
MPRRKRDESPSNGSRSGRCIEELELVEAQDTLVDLPGLLARAYDFDHVTERVTTSTSIGSGSSCQRPQGGVAWSHTFNPQSRFLPASRRN